MNKFSKLALIFTVCAGMTACSGGIVTQGDYHVIPLPKEITPENGQPFALTSSVKIYYPEGNAQMEQNAVFLSLYLKELTGFELEAVSGEGSDGILLTLDKNIPHAEGYRLKVGHEGIEIAGASEAGVFYGIQTLRKSIPIDAEGSRVMLPAVTINDYPRFAYRGMMLDVGRHFFPVDSIKIYLDMLALHHINRFHWHLSDDQGWRIEIKKYPKLTEVGSQRSETVIGHNSGKYDGKPYGGFYTQDEIREVIAYAAERHITIVPEIDLPGHQQAALASYPELGCTGGPYEVWKQWGISDDVICAGNDKAMQFLEDVLAEIIELFPSEYIHVGGDECPKVRWEKCPKCQARIKAEGIKGDSHHTAEQYLQSYVIKRMAKFVESKGRKIIGWSEILEGGLPENATVMSWLGTSSGIEAARQHHDVIMAPNTYVYFDYYQTTDTENEPDAIGGYIPLEKVYSFEPTEGIPEEGHKYIIGAQANLWTEYIPNFRQVQYMVLPRMDALAEVQWCDPSQKDYPDFLSRLMHMTQLYDKLGYNYAKHIYDPNVSLNPNPEKGCLTVSITKLGDGVVYYTTDGTEPTSASSTYTAPLEIKEDADIKAVIIRPDGSRSRMFSETVSFNKATMKPITLKEQPSQGYVFNGAPVLNDGLKGNTNYKTGRWLGFQGKDIDAVIDLKEPTEFSRVSFDTNVMKGDWIMGAIGVTIKVSDDGQTFREVASESIPSLQQKDADGIYPQEISFDTQKARYVEVIIRNGKLPSWHGGAGNPAYIFVDEICVE